MEHTLHGFLARFNTGAVFPSGAGAQIAEKMLRQPHPQRNSEIG
jgi:hypothetical protein